MAIDEPVPVLEIDVLDMAPAPVRAPGRDGSGLPQLLVRDFMQRTLTTLPSSATLREAAETMERKRIRHLLVVDGRDLSGIVSDRDLRLALPSTAAPHSPQAAQLLDGVTLGDIAVQVLYYVSPGTELRQAAMLMRDQRISCFPVLDDQSVVGILTSTDILDAFVHVTGEPDPS